MGWRDAPVVAGEAAGASWKDAPVVGASTPVAPRETMPGAPTARGGVAAPSPSSDIDFISGNLAKGVGMFAGTLPDAAQNIFNLSSMGKDMVQRALGRGNPNWQPVQGAPGTGQSNIEMMRRVGIINPSAEPESKGGEYAAAALQMLPGATLARPGQIPNVPQAIKTAGTAAGAGLAGQAGADIGGEEWRGPASMLPGAHSMQTRPAGERATAARQAEAFGKAKDMGIPVPPRAMKEDRGQQSAQNLANRHLGNPEGAEITPETLNAYRGAFQADYNAAFKSPALAKGILPNRQFRDALNAIERDVTAGASQFPQTFKGMDEVTKLLSDYRQGLALPPATALRAIKKLRSDAATNFTSDAPEKVELAKAQKRISGALEDLVESSLAADRGLMGKFREARTAMAKSYDVEAALDPVTRKISGDKLSAMLSEGKPISGELRGLAEVSGAFPGAIKAPPTESGMFAKRMSPFGITHPGAVVAHAGARMLDPITLSRPYQSMMVDPRNRLSPEQERALRYLLAAQGANRGEIPAPPQ